MKAAGSAAKSWKPNGSTALGGHSGTHHRAENARSNSRVDGARRVQSQKPTNRSPFTTALYGAAS